MLWQRYLKCVRTDSAAILVFLPTQKDLCTKLFEVLVTQTMLMTPQQKAKTKYIFPHSKFVCTLPIIVTAAQCHCPMPMSLWDPVIPVRLRGTVVPKLKEFAPQAIGVFVLHSKRKVRMSFSNRQCTTRSQVWKVLFYIVIFDGLHRIYLRTLVVVINCRAIVLNWRFFRFPRFTTRVSKFRYLSHWSSFPF